MVPVPLGRGQPPRADAPKGGSLHKKPAMSMQKPVAVGSGVARPQNDSEFEEF
ncbi:MAG: hypothetical protein HOP00_13530 [Nitrospira sp.]|nr:hypothetical protein [Nitrospira sp.]